MPYSSIEATDVQVSVGPLSSLPSVEIGEKGSHRCATVMSFDDDKVSHGWAESECYTAELTLSCHDVLTVPRVAESIELVAMFRIHTSPKLLAGMLLGDACHVQ